MAQWICNAIDSWRINDHLYSPGLKLIMRQLNIATLIIDFKAVLLAAVRQPQNMATLLRQLFSCRSNYKTLYQPANHKKTVFFCLADWLIFGRK